VDPLYVAYHDTEWGLPVHDDRRHFEFLVLEGAQAGLSWITVLRKRENYRKHFADWDPVKVARFTPARVEKMLLDPGIIRNRLKVESAVSNAKAFLKLQAEFGSFDAYFWRFVNGAPIVNRWESLKELPAKTALSDAVSKDLKQRGFRFVGSTVIYAHLQATGLVNDHVTSCFRWKEVQNF
jgi:DNA-3-methyladenine glycosylase I